MRGRNGAEGEGAEVVKEGKSAPEEESAREGRTEAVEVENRPYPRDQFEHPCAVVAGYSCCDADCY